MVAHGNKMSTRDVALLVRDNSNLVWISFSTFMQICMAAIDFKLHCKFQPDSDTTLISNTVSELHSKYSFIRQIPEVHWESRFGHLAWYGGGYYAYLWSDVSAHAMRKLKWYSNVSNKQTNKQTKKCIFFFFAAIAQVLASNIWQRLLADNPLNPEAGTRIRDEFLRYGGSRSPAELMRNTLQGEPDVKYWRTVHQF
jgi:Zn-dependent oligopeptidase